MGGPVEPTHFFISPPKAKSPADLECQITFQILGVSATFFSCSWKGLSAASTVGGPVEPTHFFISPPKAKSPADLECQITFQILGVSGTFFSCSWKDLSAACVPQGIPLDPHVPQKQKIITAGRDSASPGFGACPQNLEIGAILNGFWKVKIHQELQNFNYKT